MLNKMISQISSVSKFASEEGGHDKIPFPFITDYNMSISTPTNEKKNFDFETPSCSTIESTTDSGRNLIFRLSEHRRRLRTRVHYFIVLLCFYFNAPVAWQYFSMIERYGGGLFMFLYLILFILINVPILLVKSFISQFSNRSFTANTAYCYGFRGIGMCYLLYTCLNTMSINLFLTWFCFTMVQVAYYGEIYDSTMILYEDNKTIVSFEVENLFNQTLVNNYTWHDGAFSIFPIQYMQFGIYVFITFLPFIFVGFGVNFNLKIYGLVLFSWYTYVMVLFMIALSLPHTNHNSIAYFRWNLEDIKEPAFWYSLARLVSTNTFSVHGLISVLSSFNEFRQDFRKSLLKLLSITMIFFAIATFSFCQLLRKTLRLVKLEPDILNERVTSIQIFYNGVLLALSRLIIKRGWMIMYIGSMILVNFSAALTNYLIYNVAILDLFPLLRFYKRRLIWCNLLITYFLALFGIIFFIKSGYYYVIVFDRILFGAGPALLYLLEWIGLLIYNFDYVINDCGMILKISHPIFVKVYSLFVMPVLLICQFLILCLPFHPYEFYYGMEPVNKSIEILHFLFVFLIFWIFVSYPLLDYFQFRYKENQPLVTALDLIFGEHITWGPGKEVFWNVQKYQTKLHEIEPHTTKRNNQVRNMFHYNEYFTGDSNFD